MARQHQTHVESSGRYRSTPPYAEIQKQIGNGLKQQYEPLPKELPHQLFALLLQIQDQEEKGPPQLS
jgi:hypothetical protein